MGLPGARAAKALNLIVQRYARPLGLTGKEMQEALQGEGAGRRAPPAGAKAPAPAADPSAAPATNQPAATPKPPAGPWSEALAGTLS
jgi:hypothetical protein